MPFKSKSQMRFMYSQHPKIAARWEKETKNEKDLPETAKKKSPWMDMGKKGGK
jgi:hypothetical protein